MASKAQKKMSSLLKDNYFFPDSTKKEYIKQENDKALQSKSYLNHLATHQEEPAKKNTGPSSNKSVYVSSASCFSKNGTPRDALKPISTPYLPDQKNQNNARDSYLYLTTSNSNIKDNSFLKKNTEAQGSVNGNGTQSIEKKMFQDIRASTTNLHQRASISQNQVYISSSINTQALNKGQFKQKPIINSSVENIPSIVSPQNALPNYSSNKTYNYTDYNSVKKDYSQNIEPTINSSYSLQKVPANIRYSTVNLSPPISPQNASIFNIGENKYFSTFDSQIKMEANENEKWKEKYEKLQTAMTAQIEQLKREINQANSALQKEIQEKTIYSKTISEKTNLITSLENKLLELTTENKKLLDNTDVNNLKTRIAALENERKTTLEKIERQQSRFEEIVYEMKMNFERASRKEMELQAIEIREQILQDEALKIENLEEKIIELTTQKDQIREKHSTLETKYEKLKQKYQKLTSEAKDEKNRWSDSFSSQKSPKNIHIISEPKGYNFFSAFNGANTHSSSTTPSSN